MSTMHLPLATKVTLELIVSKHLPAEHLWSEAVALHRSEVALAVPRHSAEILVGRPHITLEKHLHMVDLETLSQ